MPEPSKARQKRITPVVFGLRTSAALIVRHRLTSKNKKRWSLLATVFRFKGLEAGHQVSLLDSPDDD